MPELTPDQIELMLYGVPASGLIALAYSYWKASWVAQQEEGNDVMKDIAGRIQEGAMAFLTAEYKVLAGFVAGFRQVVRTRVFL